MSDKTKNFSFNIKENNIFEYQPKAKRSVGGRPKKIEEDKLSIQKTVKFTSDEHNALLDCYQNTKTQFSSFSSYLRYLILNNINKH